MFYWPWLSARWKISWHYLEYLPSADQRGIPGLCASLRKLKIRVGVDHLSLCRLLPGLARLGTSLYGQDCGSLRYRLPLWPAWGRPVWVRNLLGSPVRLRLGPCPGLLGPSWEDFGLGFRVQVVNEQIQTLLLIIIIIIIFQKSSFFGFFCSNPKIIYPGPNFSLSSRTSPMISLMPASTSAGMARRPDR